MCPLWPIHYVLLYIAAFIPVWLLSSRIVGAAAGAAEKSTSWNVGYKRANQDPIRVGDIATFEMNISEWNIKPGEKVWIDYVVSDPDIATVSTGPTEVSDSDSITSFNVTGKFLGYTEVCPHVRYSSPEKNITETVEVKCEELAVARKPRAIDRAFTYSVIILVAIIYINMGAALDLRIVRDTLKRPVGPIIGFCTQFGIMPLLAFGIGKWLLSPTEKKGLTGPAMQLGLFLTGCSPGGGASNIWTLTMGGNLNLSITMTAISTFSAFFMMPAWFFTLGHFYDRALIIPNAKIANFAICLIVPLSIGLLIQRFLPKFGKVLVRILKPFAILLIVFIVLFAIVTNWFLFKLFSWRILLAGMLLPTMGYLLGGGAATLLRQDKRDIIAIAIETGVQNTGLAILALQISYSDKPLEADLATALPVAVAIMTPLLPITGLIYQKIRGQKCVDEEEPKDPLFQNHEEVSNPQVITEGALQQLQMSIAGITRVVCSAPSVKKIFLLVREDEGADAES